MDAKTLQRAKLLEKNIRTLEEANKMLQLRPGRERINFNIARVAVFPSGFGVSVPSGTYVSHPKFSRLLQHIHKITQNAILEVLDEYQSELSNL